MLLLSEEKNFLVMALIIFLLFYFTFLRGNIILKSQLIFSLSVCYLFILDHDHSFLLSNIL